MDLYIYKKDEYTSDSKQGNVYAPVWPFRLIVSGSSDSGKTTMIMNLLMGDATAKEDGSRYILCDAVVLIGRYLDEPKWQIVKDFFDEIDDVTFQAIPYMEMPTVDDFDPDIATVVVFEDLMDAPKEIQEKISSYFIRGRHRNISAIYVAQRFFAIPKAIRDNATYISLHGGHGNLTDTKRIIRQYTSESDSLAPIIDELTLAREFVVFDLRRPKTDPLSIRVRWDTSIKTVIESSYNDPKTILQSSYNDPKTILQSSYNDPKTILESSYNDLKTVTRACRFSHYGQKAVSEAKKNGQLVEFARNYPSPKERKLLLVSDVLPKAKNADVWARYVFREAYGIDDRILGDEYKKFLSQVKQDILHTDTKESTNPFSRYKELLGERPLDNQKIIEGIDVLLKLFRAGSMKRPILQVGINSLFHSS
jgi:hypothetical protein